MTRVFNDLSFLKFHGGKNVVKLVLNLLRNQAFYELLKRYDILSKFP